MCVYVFECVLGIYYITHCKIIYISQGILFTFEEFRLPGSVCGKTYVVIGEEIICGIHHGRMLVESSTVDVVYKTEAPDDNSYFLIRYDEFQMEDFNMLTTPVTANPIFATFRKPTNKPIPPINHRWNSTLPTNTTKPTFSNIEEPPNTHIPPSTQPRNSIIPTITAKRAVEEPANTPISLRTQPHNTTIPTITARPTFPTVEEPGNTPIPPKTQSRNGTLPMMTSQSTFPTVEEPASTSIPTRTQPRNRPIPMTTAKPTFPTVDEGTNTPIPTTTQPWISTLPTILTYRTKPKAKKGNCLWLIILLFSTSQAVLISEPPRSTFTVRFISLPFPFPCWR